MAQLTDAFIIFHRDIHGRPDFIYPYDGRLAACVTTSINIARGYLRNATVQAALVSFAKDLDRAGPHNAWHNDPVHGCGGPEGAVFAFIRIILAVFPLTGIDDSIHNPDELAFVVKRPWDVHFDPLDHPIVLNGHVRGYILAPDAIGPNKANRDQRVRDMVEATTRARGTMNRSDYDNKQLRTFNFIFANAIFHELCHLFLTFLTKGRILTPPQFNARVKGYVEEGRGEAGRYMETMLFGGTLEYYRDRNHGDKQSGLPYIYNKDGARRIPQETIDAVNNYQFHFPYRLKGPTFNSKDLESLGEYQAEDHLTDPMTWPIMQDFKRYKHTVTFHPRPDFQRPSYPPGFEAPGPVGAPPRHPGMML